ncbi:MAG: hypothetical protein ACI8Q1_003585 [Parvicella sp.]|jgi:hypothetical protein
MKQIILFLTLLLVGITTCNAQKIFMTSLKVKYSVKTERITSKMEMDIGSYDLDHPLHGAVTCVNHSIVVINIEGESRSFENEVDLISFLLNDGWEIYHSSKIVVYKEHYTNYLFTKQVK